MKLHLYTPLSKNELETLLDRLVRLEHMYEEGIFAKDATEQFCDELLTKHKTKEVLTLEVSELLKIALSWLQNGKLTQDVTLGLINGLRPKQMAYKSLYDRLVHWAGIETYRKENPELYQVLATTQRERESLERSQLEAAKKIIDQ